MTFCKLTTEFSFDNIMQSHHETKQDSLGFTKKILRTHWEINVQTAMHIILFLTFLPSLPYALSKSPELVSFNISVNLREEEEREDIFSTSK